MLAAVFATVHSGHIGNTFGPKGLSIGSSRQVVIEIAPVVCMKVTSQMRSPTWMTPTFCQAKA
jgi:hypothetical protein